MLRGIVFGANGYDCASCHLLLCGTGGDSGVFFVGRASSSIAPAFNEPIELGAHNYGLLRLQRLKYLLLV